VNPITCQYLLHAYALVWREVLKESSVLPKILTSSWNKVRLLDKIKKNWEPKCAIVSAQMKVSCEK